MPGLVGATEEGDIVKVNKDALRTGFVFLETTGKVDLTRVRCCVEDTLDAGVQVYGSIQRNENRPGAECLLVLLEHKSAESVDDISARLAEALKSPEGIGDSVTFLVYEEEEDIGDGVPEGIWYESRQKWIERQDDAKMFKSVGERSNGEDHNSWILFDLDMERERWEVDDFLVL